MARPAVFFDRDNTLIASDGYLGDPDKVELVAGAASAVARATKLGYAVVVVSNQSGVARGMFGEEDVDAVNRRMDEMLRAVDPAAVVVMHVFCPFHPDAVIDKYRQDSPLRKPSPGMLTLAAEQLDLDLSRSWLVGDAPRDIEAGRRAGCRTILFNDPTLPLSPAAKEPLETPPDQIVSTLGQAIDYIEVHGDAPPPPAPVVASVLQERVAEVAPVVDEPIARVPLFSRNEETADRATGRPSLFARVEDASTTAVVSDVSVAEVDEDSPPAGAAVDVGLVLVEAERHRAAKEAAGQSESVVLAVDDADTTDDIAALTHADDDDASKAGVASLANEEADDDATAIDHETSATVANPWTTAAADDESPEAAVAGEESASETDIDLFKAVNASAAVEAPAESSSRTETSEREVVASVDDSSAAAEEAIEEASRASRASVEPSESPISADADVSQHFLESVELPASPPVALAEEPQPLVRPSAWVHRATTPREHEPTVSPADDLLIAPSPDESAADPARDELPMSRVEAPIADLPASTPVVIEALTPRPATDDVPHRLSPAAAVLPVKTVSVEAPPPPAPSPRGMIAATLRATTEPVERVPIEPRRGSPEASSTLARNPAVAPQASTPRVEPSRPSDPPMTPRMELLTEQILRELRRRESPRAADFSLAKLVAAVMQVIAFGLLALAVYNWNNKAGNVYAFLMAAQLVQTFVVAMMLVDRKS